MSCTQNWNYNIHSTDGVWVLNWIIWKTKGNIKRSFEQWTVKPWSVWLIDIAFFLKWKHYIWATFSCMEKSQRFEVCVESKLWIYQSSTKLNEKKLNNKWDINLHLFQHIDWQHWISHLLITMIKRYLQTVVQVFANHQLNPKIKKKKWNKNN